MKLKEDAPLIKTLGGRGAWLRCVQIYAVQSGRDPTHDTHSYIEKLAVALVSKSQDLFPRKKNPKT